MYISLQSIFSASLSKLKLDKFEVEICPGHADEFSGRWSNLEVEIWHYDDDHGGVDFIARVFSHFLAQYNGLRRVMIDIRIDTAHHVLIRLVCSVEVVCFTSNCEHDRCGYGGRVCDLVIIMVVVCGASLGTVIETFALVFVWVTIVHSVFDGCRSHEGSWTHS